MATFIQVKKDREFYQSLSSLLKVLKGIAVSQYQILERKIQSFDKFSEVVNLFIEGIDVSPLSHPFLNPSKGNQGVLAVTSDSGLLGGLNIQVMKRAFEAMKGPSDQLLIVGERGKVYAREQKIPYTGFPGIIEEKRLELALTIRDFIMSKVMKGAFGRVVIIFPQAYSLTLQKINRVDPLPYSQNKDIPDSDRLNLDVFVQESSVGDVVEYLVYLWLGQRLYEILGQAKLAELAARFIHLEDSSQKLEELDKELKLKYFRLKHELTDASMREIFASRLLHR